MALSEHLEKLRHFHKLVGYSSIREGSTAIGISQAGLSKSVAALEAVLDCQLFLRSREGLTLTKEGEEVFRTSQLILQEASAVEKRLRIKKISKTPARLHIGMYDSIAVYFFSELKGYLETLYPNVDLALTVDASGALQKSILENKLDLAIGVNLDRDKVNGTYFKLFDDHYSFYMSAKHELDLNNARLIIHSRADDHERKTIEEYLKNAIKDRGAHNVLNFETIKTMTSQGLGIGVLPTQVAKPLVKTGALVSVKVPKAKHLFGKHSIGFLATASFLKNHRDFSEDIIRIGERWSKI